MTRQIVIADSSRISTFGECPEKLNLSYKQNLTHFDDEKEAISAGTYGHKLMEIYYNCIARGSKPDVASGIALKFDVDKEDKVDPQFPLSDENRKLVRSRFEKYWMLHTGRDFEPGFQRLSQYQITIDENGLPVDNYVDVIDPLVEKGFSYPVLDTKEYLFILEGRIDLIDTSNNLRKFVDHKFQFRERKLYEKSIQFRNYALASGCNFGIINYIRLHKSETDKTFVRQPISFNPGELQVWKEELTEIYIRMAKAEKSGEYYRERSSCPGKYGYSCEFTHICDEPNEFVRINIKNTNYKKKVEWKPW